MLWNDEGKLFLPLRNNNNYSKSRVKATQRILDTVHHTKKSAKLEEITTNFSSAILDFGFKGIICTGRVESTISFLYDLPSTSCL